MAEYDKSKYYWFHMKEDFFKRHDIKIIKAMPNGKDYVIFYLQLLCESLSHNGRLRFSDNIPYNPEMLSIITETNIDVVKSAMKLFQELDLIEVFDDQTIYMTQIEHLIGFTTKGAEKKQLQRQTQKLAIAATGGQWVDRCPPDIDIEKDIDIEIEREIKENKEKSIEKKEKKSVRFTPPSIDEVRAYCLERKNGINAEQFIDFYTSKGWKIGKETMKDWKAAVRTWERRDGRRGANGVLLSNETDDILDGIL